MAGLLSLATELLQEICDEVIHFREEKSTLTLMMTHNSWTYLGTRTSATYALFVNL